MDGLESQLTVILPAHNEAANIAAVVEGVRSNAPGARLLVVDDGSSDDTSARAVEAGAEVIRLDPNLGKGRALREGVMRSSGDVLVFIDADGQDDPAEIPAMLAALRPDVDLVLGSRFVGRFNRGAITRLNWLGTKCITLLGDILFRCRITDPCAGFRAVRRSALEAIELKADGYDIEVDVVFGILRAGGRVIEVPAVRSPRASGRSGLSSFRDGLRIVRRMVQIRLERRPRLISTRPAAADHGMSSGRSGGASDLD
jgi:glycosyltransferase involved in cell wall biosynthesis